MFLLVLAYPGSPGQGPFNGCVCVCVYVQCACFSWQALYENLRERAEPFEVIILIFDFSHL